MIILGLDIATTTGYGIISGNKVIAYGKISLKDYKEYRERFKHFRVEVSKLIKKYKPKVVVIEQTYVGANPKTTAYLNMLRGICIELVPKKSSIISETVTSIRKQVMGSGKKHSKLDVFCYVTVRYRLEGLSRTKDLDISDALLLCDWGRQLCQDN
jgi:crossover junction endodeoxyribonuclease RuvC